MEEKKPRGKGRPFQKGVSGNPKGRPPLPPELKLIKELTVDELKRTIAKYFRLPKDQVELILEDGALPAIDHLVAATIKVAIERGDIARAEYLFMRAFGKVTDEAKTEPPEPVIIKRLSGEQVSLETKPLGLEAQQPN